MSSVLQSEPIRIKFALQSAKLDRRTRLTIFALLARGILEETLNGDLSIDDAIRKFFNYENAEYVRKNLESKLAEEIIARSIVLPNLINVLGMKRGKKELVTELKTLLGMCGDIIHAAPRTKSGEKPEQRKPSQRMEKLP